MPPHTRQRVAQTETSVPVNRPRTRAFVKEHGLKIPDIFESARVTKQNQALGVDKPESPTFAKGRGVKGRNISREYHNTPISAWLGSVTADHPETQLTIESSPLLTTSTEWEVETMVSSSSMNTSETTTTENLASTKASTVKKKKQAKISYQELLEFRGVTDEPSPDERFKSMDLEKLKQAVDVHLDLDSLNSILSMLHKHEVEIRKAIRNKKVEYNIHLYEDVREDLEDWVPKKESHRRFPGISNRRFTHDREHCRTSNEANFQRTLMISVIDHYDFRELFDYSCEEKWTLESEYLLPPLGSPNTISQPKPDLAISFQRNAIRDKVLLPYPVRLSRCLHPGKNGNHRWFPFLFVEAKRADHTLEYAQEQNLHSASQALFNIYQWMKFDNDLLEKFVDSVRIFTVALNVETFRLRMHRAKIVAESSEEDDRLYYHFQELIRIDDYDRTKVCGIMKTILLDYAKPCLLPILRDAFKRVSDREMKRGKMKKRKQTELDQNAPMATEVDEYEEAESTTTDSVSDQQGTTTGLSFKAREMHISRKRGRIEKPSRR